jgi:hypothetical protein
METWDVGTGQECAAIRGHDVFSVVYGPDGRLATGGNDGTVRVWEADHGRELLTLRGHTDVVFELAFTPDRHQLISTCADRTVTRRFQRVRAVGRRDGTATVQAPDDERRVAPTPGIRPGRETGGRV